MAIIDREPVDSGSKSKISHFIILKMAGRGISVGSVSASQAAVPRSMLASGTFFREKNPLLLMQEDIVVNYWRKNWHLILVNFLREACPETVWLSN